MMQEPIVFNPIYQERVWGGRELERRYGRVLPRPDVPYGESWELCDRPEAQSEVIWPGEWKGKTLGELWRGSRDEIFGEGLVDAKGPFPLLLKILDARDRLSIQVHPPAEVASTLGGEPKTEMWYIADAAPAAVLYVGLEKGVTRKDFEAGIAGGKTEDQVHRIPVTAGDFIFIPSGRLHAIGAGLLIYEMQQNSDTTYRVFDWNRVGLDGIPRELHVDASLQCIDFDDVEPDIGTADGERLVKCPEFVVEEWRLPEGESRDGNADGEFASITVVTGRVACGSREFTAGDFFLVAASAEGAGRALVSGEGEARVLVTRVGD